MAGIFSKTSSKAVNLQPCARCAVSPGPVQAVDGRQACSAVDAPYLNGIGYPNANAALCRLGGHQACSPAGFAPEQPWRRAGGRVRTPDQTEWAGGQTQRTGGMRAQGGTRKLNTRMRGGETQGRGAAEACRMHEATGKTHGR